MKLLYADWFFTILHLAIIGFNLLGWISPRTRVAHRWCVGITALCWLVLGPLLGEGVGYCPITAWHYRIKHMRGIHNLPSSYIDYLLRLAGIHMRPDHVDVMTGTAFAMVIVITIGLWIQEKRVRA